MPRKRKKTVQQHENIYIHIKKNSLKSVGIFMLLALTFFLSIAGVVNIEKISKLKAEHLADEGIEYKSEFTGDMKTISPEEMLKSIHVSLVISLVLLLLITFASFFTLITGLWRIE